MSARLTPALVVAAALLLAACGEGAAPTTSAAPGSVTSPEYLAFREQPTACGAEAPAAAKSLCEDRFEAFGSAGQAACIQPLPLDRMALRYR